MSTSDGIQGTGYDKKLNVNYSILKEILRESNFDEFLRACPRYVEFVTEMDITRLLYFKGIAESWSDEEIELPGNLMDVRQFNDCKGRIVASILTEIKRGDPRNLEYEVVQDSMLDMNNLTAAVTEKVMSSDHFIKKVQESLENKEDKGISEGEVEASINLIETELSGLSRRLNILENSEGSSHHSDNEEFKQKKVESPKETKMIEINVNRSWSVRVSDADKSFIIKEKRGKEEGGTLNVEISDGLGSLVWKVNTTKLGHSQLYERIKKVLLEYLSEGSVSSEQNYSFPVERENRNFSPEIRGGRVISIDNWVPRKGLFNREYEQALTLTVGESSWSVDIRMKNSDVASFKKTLEELMAMILLSGDEVTDDSRSYK